MKKFVNLFVKDKIVGGIDWNLLQAQQDKDYALDICTSSNIIVGYISTDVLRLVYDEEARYRGKLDTDRPAINTGRKEGHDEKR